MINEKVVHKKFGEGIIVAVEGETITIAFQDEEKKLQIPLAFEKGFLQMVDLEKQRTYLAGVEEEKERAAAEKAAEEARLIKEKTSKKKKVKHGSNLAIADLQIGQIYTNDELMAAFAVSGQGGMRKSNTTNSLVLISKHDANDKERNPYEDKWEEDGFFHYTGMGLSGDQDLNYLQNKTLSESNLNGVDVYLFESYKANEYTYRGEVRLAKVPYPMNEEDADGQRRRVYKFPLKVMRK